MHKKVALIVTSYHAPFYPDGKPTGAFLCELQHPYHVFRENGFEVDFISENGKYGWDHHSVNPPFLVGKDKEEFDDLSSDFNETLRNIKTPREVNADDYDIFYASAGHGTLFDFPTAEGIRLLATSIYVRGGIVSAVCHGPVIFSGLKNPTTGKPLIEGKAITGFTELGEKLLKVQDIMDEKGLYTIEQVAREEGAIYLPPMLPWEDYSVTSGRIVTGLNPASAASTAKRCVIALKHHKDQLPHPSVDDLAKLDLTDEAKQTILETTAYKVPDLAATTRK